jgi:DNA-binding NarL/FixJ family response regulator
MLVQTRVFILQRSGHKAIGALSEEQVVALCAEYKFDVAVIGQMLSAEKKRRILELLRKHSPSAKVLELYNVTTGKSLPDADAWLDVPASIPEHLPEKVAALAASA